jgi:hypothetical protein
VSAIAGRALSCIVCGGEIRLLAVGTDAVCESAHCRVLMTRRASIGPDGFRFLIEVRRRQRREQGERAEAERLRLAERSALEALEHESIREAVSREEEVPASSYPLLVLPRGPHGLERVSRQRRQRFREHLDAIIAETVSGEANDAATARDESIAADPVTPLAAQLCTLCRGGCCSQGGDKAYLTAATIRRFMRLRPDLAADRIAAEYLDRLGDQIVAGSCIHHTGTGCSLPRQMRADTCNDYFCKPMREWQARCETGERPLGAFVIQRREDNWSKDRSDVANEVVGISVVTETGSRSLAKNEKGPGNEAFHVQGVR